MSRLIKNPISTTFIIVSVGLLIISILGRGGFDDFGKALQFIFVPYTYDFARKLGQSQEDLIVLILVVMQVLLIFSIFTISRVTSRRNKLLMSILGVLLVICYFSFIFLAGLLTAIH